MMNMKNLESRLNALLVRSNDMERVKADKKYFDYVLGCNGGNNPALTERELSLVSPMLRAALPLESASRGES
jgi:hypothetical protein